MKSRIFLLLINSSLVGHTIAGSITADTGTAPDWCGWLGGKPGLLHKDSNHPWIQSLQLEGRFQYQIGYVDGEGTDGVDFHEDYDDYRRFRLGLKSAFLDVLDAKVAVDLVDDNRFRGEELDWGFAGFDEAWLGLDIGKAFGTGPLDSVKLSYGRHKFVIGNEAHTSSTRLLTVERSALSNKVYESARPTGALLAADVGRWSFSTAAFSSTEDGAENESLSGWQDGVIWYGGAEYEIDERWKVGADFVWNDADAVDEDSILSYRWASSLHATYDAGRWGVIGDVIVGDNGGSAMHGNNDRRGGFHGFMVMPYQWIIDKKLQWVGQYQYAGADSPEGVRVNSRYGRADGIGDVNDGRGDSHHSLYTGLNWHLCDHFAKVQAGVEWQTMDTPDGSFDTLTWLLALRTSF
jgi:phosphate-selective porin